MLHRQRTLRAAIDWSHDMLSDAERALFARLSVFAGPFAADAVGTICSGAALAEADVAGLLTRLVDRSLVVAEDGRIAPRYRLLDTLRRYGEERLADKGWASETQRRHLEWFCDLAERVSREYARDRESALDLLEDDYENYRVALDRGLHSSLLEPAMKLVGALGPLWHIRGRMTEGRTSVERALRAQGECDPRDRARALGIGGLLASRQGDYEEARSHYHEALQIRRSLGEEAEAASMLLGLGLVAYDRGDYPAARKAYEEAAAMQRSVDDETGLGDSLMKIGLVALYQGDPGAAHASYEEALAMARRLGNTLGVAAALGNLGELAMYREDVETAEAHLSEALEISRQLGHRAGVATALGGLAALARRRGDHDRMRSLHEEALEIRRELEDRPGIAHSLSMLGGAALARGEPAAARPLFEESLAIAEELGIRRTAAVALRGLGRTCEAEGDSEGALAKYAGALAVSSEIGILGDVAETLRMIARVEASCGRQRRAARLLGAAETLRVEAGATPFPEDPSIASALATLDSDSLERALAEGREMPLDEAIAYALGS